MTKTDYQCPATDCDYTGVRSSVQGHYAGKKDSEHSGGWEKADVLLKDQDNGDSKETERQSDDSPGSDPGMGTNKETQSSPAGGGADNHRGNPAFAGPENTQGGSNSMSEVDLPCGHESFNPDQAPDDKGYVTCDTCGKTFPYEL